MVDQSGFARHAYRMSSAFDATYWNRIQTLGWIYFRDREFVQEAGNPNADQSQISLILQTEEIPPVLPSLGGANDLLYEALRSEALVAVGMFGGDAESKPIPATFWAHGKVYEDPEIALPVSLAPWTKGWKKLRFPRVQVLQLWPDVKSRAIRPTDPVRLSFFQFAGRWIAENPGIGINQDGLAVDLIRLAEDGAFLRAPQEGEAVDQNFDPHVGRYITTFDQQGRMAEPWAIRNYTTAGKPGTEWTQRLRAARDIEAELAAVEDWLGSERGKAWREPRGLLMPKFISGRSEAPVVSMISEEGRCTQWLLSLMKEANPDRPKSELKAEAFGMFKISGAGFQRCWTVAIRESDNLNWSKSGPRRRKGTANS